VRASGTTPQDVTVGAAVWTPDDTVFSGFGCRCWVRFNGDVNWPAIHTYITVHRTLPTENLQCLL